MDPLGAEKLITALGFSTDVARLYERVLSLSGRPFDEVTVHLGLSRAEFEVLAAPLIEAEIVEVGPEAMDVLTPAVALSRMLEAAAERARRAQLEESLQPIDGEVFRARSRSETLSTIVQHTTGDLAWLMPDQWRLPSEGAMNQLLDEVVASGRRARGIYPVRALSEAPGVLQARAEVGEEIRVLPEVAARLLVIGTTHALLPEPLGEMTMPRILVRQRGIVEALGMLFEQMWHQASPLAAYERGVRGDELRRQLLQQLASGAQDEQVARRLGLSLRTVRRRVAEVMAELGAESRFQAGVEAARRGWL
jgi:DNA-binding CsgD family transcriptional regulator